MLFDAHWHGFRVFGGIPERGIYDNMRTAVEPPTGVDGEVVGHVPPQSALHTCNGRPIGRLKGTDQGYIQRDAKGFLEQISSMGAKAVERLQQAA